MKGKILAGALGNCVHVAGVVSILRQAEELGYETVFLGSAVPVDEFIEAIHEHDPDIVGVSYRLSPEVAERLLADFADKLSPSDRQRRFAFGGTPPVCRVAEQTDLFERCFDGLEHMGETIAWLGGRSECLEQRYCDSLGERIAASGSIPLLRHHFGLPDFEQTRAGIEEIAAARVLDVISLAPDQNAQESFFRPAAMDPMLEGAGGVPVRSREQLEALKKASERGNFPLMRIYSGTRDLVQWAELSAATINNAWGAIPLCWYSTLDGRSDRLPETAIRENQEAMRWYGSRSIPLEVNESHHWSLRDAHDTIAVVMAYLAAYNAKAAGVSEYVAQYMFNTPPMTSATMDLAKMLAKIELIESLHDESFHSWRQARAGLLHLSPRENVAKGQLAASTAIALQIKPHIIHVVGFCEGDHAATAPDVIESCDIVHGVMRNLLNGQPEMLNNAEVQARKTVLVSEANQLLEAIRCLGEEEERDPLASPRVLAEAIRIGLLDAPHLRGHSDAAGILDTRAVNGAIVAWDKAAKRPLTEKERIAKIMANRTTAVWAI